MSEQEMKTIANAFHQLDRAAVGALNAGQYQDAAQAYREMLRAERSMHMELQSARTMMNLASVLLLAEEYEEALEMTSEAGSVFDHIGTQEDRLHSRQTAAAIYQAQKKYEDALAMLKQAAVFCTRSRLRGQLELSFFELYSSQGLIPLARNAIQRAVQHFESSGDGADLRRALLLRADFFEANGQRQAAALDRARLSTLEG